MSGETREKTRILLADGQDVVRQGIRHILEREPDFEVVGDTDNHCLQIIPRNNIFPPIGRFASHLLGKEFRCVRINIGYDGQLCILKFYDGPCPAPPLPARAYQSDFHNVRRFP